MLIEDFKKIILYGFIILAIMRQIKKNSNIFYQHEVSLVVRKPVFGVSDHVRHKPGCTATEDGYRLEISDLDRRGIALSVQRKQRR